MAYILSVDIMEYDHRDHRVGNESNHGISSHNNNESVSGTSCQPAGAKRMGSRMTKEKKSCDIRLGS